MRTARLTLAVLAVAVACGCEGLLKRDREPAARVPSGPPPERSAQQLVEYLNRQAALVRTLEYSDVSVSATEAGQRFPGLRDSTLIAAQPRNIRLIGGTELTSQELDIGSNSREFWMYVKRLPGDNYFYCSHDDFARGQAKLPMPFDTDWVMQALGMHVYPTDAQYQVQTSNRDYVLTSRTTTSTGQPVVKQTIFNTDWDRGTLPVVRRHVVADESGRVLAVADIKRVKTIGTGPNGPRDFSSFIQVPTEAVLEWPQQRFEMRLSLGKERINESLDDRAAMLFQKPNIRGTNPIDLATYQFVAPTGYNARGQAPGRETRKVYVWPRFADR
jgi:hypothetical protein